MALTTELINTTFAEHKEPLVDSSLRNTRFWSIIEKQGRPGEGGTYVERNIAGQSPAVAKGIFSGDEVLNMTRRQIMKKFQVEYHRIVGAINIPNYELKINSGKNGVIKLIKAYPMQFMTQFASDLDQYLLTGAVRGLGALGTTDAAGLLTLNGLFSSGTRTGVTNGLLDMVAIGSQTETVQNVAKSTTYFHYNHWDSISSWSGEGEETLRAMGRTVAEWGGITNDLSGLYVLPDPDTYKNYESNKLSNVRVTVVNDKDTSKVVDLDLQGAQVIFTSAMDRANFGSPASTGVTYFINPKFIEVLFLQKPTIGQFIDRIAEQDVVTAKFEMMLAWLCTKPTAQGVVTGGAT